MHSHQQTANAIFLFVILIDITSRKFVNLIDNHIPSTKIKISYTEIHTLYTARGHNALQALFELNLYVIVYSCHIVRILRFQLF